VATISLEKLKMGQILATFWQLLKKEKEKDILPKRLSVSHLDEFLPKKKKEVLFTRSLIHRRQSKASCISLCCNVEGNCTRLRLRT
jgi:hypothetical protein